MKKIVCYARVSDEKQTERDLSIPAQLKALKNMHPIMDLR